MPLRRLGEHFRFDLWLEAFRRPVWSHSYVTASGPMRRSCPGSFGAGVQEFFKMKSVGRAGL